MPNPIVHFEVNGADAESTAKFYSELFGWHTESMPQMGYVMVDTHAGEGINGGFGSPPDGSKAIVFYVEVADLQATLDKAESLGGKTTMPVTEIPNVVTFAQFADPDGNIIGLVAGGPGGDGPGVSAGSNPSVGWFEVAVGDFKAGTAFYADLFGWHVKASDNPQMQYGEIDTHAGKGINGGIAPAAMSGGNSYVTVYAKVDDVEDYLGRAEKLGGAKIMGPMQVDDTLTVGMFADNQGRMFGLFSQKA